MSNTDGQGMPGHRQPAHAGQPGRGPGGGHRERPGQWPPPGGSGGWSPADRQGPEPGVRGRAEQAGGRHEDRRRGRRRRGWLLLIAIIAPLLSPLTNSDSPELWGIPFFYWYQLFCAVLAITVITAAFLMSREQR